MRRSRLLLFIGAVLLLWPALALAQWETPNRSFHKPPVFPLEGKHLTVPCASCHLNGMTKGTPRTCTECHWARRQDDPYRGRLGMQCEQCHRTTSWTAVRWEHASATGVALNAAHKTIGCDSCHRNSLFTSVTLSCANCHAKDYDGAKQPDHRAAGFPQNCDLCHKASDVAFSQGRFSHASVFPLVGPHAVQACETCHVNNRYKGTPTDCVGCHRDDYQQTAAPNHAAAGFSTDCVQCHRPTDASFGGAQPFNHASVFPLVGLHATQGCASCHRNGIYKGTPRDCVGCHQVDYQKTTTPNHASSGFSTDCIGCHRATDASWRSGQGFNHSSVFPLAGQHATQGCASCHVNGVYKGTPRDCVGCHRDEYQKTTTPNHASSGFSTDCAGCHRATDASWRSGQGFNHSAVFGLVGQHATQACTTCHGNGVYKGTPRDCVGCHQDDYQRTSSPNHAASGFSTACDACHRATDASWRGGSFNHGSVFQLLGVHATVACGVCHTNNVYRGTSRTCVGCHLDEYTRTTNPNHLGAQFPTTCEVCHRGADTSWRQGTFNHTWFPITSGKHANRQCSECHQNPSNYTVFTCTTCHGRTQMDDKHKGRAGYAYDSNRCYACHPDGRE